MSVQGVGGAAGTIRPVGGPIGGKAPAGDGARGTGASRAGGAAAGAERARETVLALLDAQARHRFGRRDGGADERAPRSAGDEDASPAAGDGSARSVDPRAAEAEAAFRERFADTASDHDDFHALMRQVYGEGYDYAAAESIRQRTLDGDFGWMPDIAVMTSAEMADVSGQQTGGTALGAYDASSDTIYLSAELLAGDPARAVDILTEEVGHAIDVRVNESDSLGDEGELFSRLVSGEEVTPEELAALRAENDHGVIYIDGRAVEVEYGCNPFKAVGNLIKGAVDAVVGVVKGVIDTVVDFVKDALKAIGDFFVAMFETFMEVVGEILQSKIFQIFMFIAQFIPVLAVFVMVVRIVQAVYMIYQGIKHGSLAMVLGGVASLAGGVAKLGTAMGASQGFIDTANRVADWASKASKAYSAMAERDFSAGLSLLAGEVQGTEFESVVSNLQKADAAVKAYERGDIVGAMGIGADLANSLPGDFGDEFMETLAEHADAIGAIVQAVEDGDYSEVAALIGEHYGDDLGLSDDFRARSEQVGQSFETLAAVANAIDENDYAGAALLLIDDAKGYVEGDEARAALDRAAERVRQLDAVAGAFGEEDFAEVIALTSEFLGEPLDPVTRERLETFQTRARQVETIVRAVDDGDLAGALDVGIALLDGIPGNQGEGTLRALGAHGERLESAYEAARTGDYDTAAALLTEAYGESAGLSAEASAGIVRVAGSFETLARARDLADAGDHEGAALLIIEDAQGYAVGDTNRERLESLAGAVRAVGGVIESYERGDYTDALAGASALLGGPLDPATEATLRGIETRAEALVAAHEAFDEGDVGEGVLAVLTFARAGAEGAETGGFLETVETLATVEVLVSEERHAEALELVAELAERVDNAVLAQVLRGLAGVIRVEAERRERNVA